MKYAKVSAICLAGLLTLTGCSMLGPKNPSDVVAKYKAQMEKELSYHADMDMDFEISASGQGMTIELPVTLGMSMDVTESNLYGTMDMSLAFMGQSMEESTEVYMEKEKDSITIYTHDKETDTWTKSSEDRGADNLAAGFANLKEKAFEDAEMEKTKDGYIITQNLEDFADAADIYESLEEMYGDIASSMNIDVEDLLEEWEDAEVTYTFDKNCLLTSVEIDGCTYSDTIENEGVEMNVEVSLSLAYEFSDYGEIEKEDVEVPKSVKKSAVEPSVEGEVKDNPLDVEEPIGVPTPDEMVDPAAVPETDMDADFLVNPAIGLDTMGSYNGIPLSATGSSWDETFGADGWEFTSDDGEFVFMTAENSQYPDVDLYVYSKSRGNATKADILSNGFYGYDIDASFASEYPPFTFNNLTFGASAEEILTAYGEPAYEPYVGSMYTTYDYKLDNNTEMTFYVYPEGLKKVNLSYYGGM